MKMTNEMVEDEDKIIRNILTELNILEANLCTNLNDVRNMGYNLLGYEYKELILEGIEKTSICDTIYLRLKRLSVIEDSLYNILSDLNKQIIK